MRLPRFALSYLGLFLAFAVDAYPQAKPFKSYKTNEEYCQDNPKMPTCIKGKPLDPKLLMGNGGIPYVRPNGSTAPRSTAPRMSAPQAVTAAPTMVVLGVPDMRFAHPIPDMMMGLNISGLTKSPFFRTLVNQIATASGIGAADVESAIVQAGGVEKVVVSLRAKDVLMLATGKLDTLESLAKPDNGPMTFHTVSADTIVVGAEPSLSQSMTRLALARQPVSSIVQRAKNLSETSDLWVIATPSLMASFGKPVAPGSGITSFTVAVTLGDPIRSDIVIQSSTAAGAQRLYAESKKDQKPSAVGRQTTTIEGTAVRYSFVIEQSDAQKGVDELMASSYGRQLSALIASSKTAASAAAARRPAPEPEHHPGKVIIYGLEDKPKEISIGKP